MPDDAPSLKLVCLTMKEIVHAIETDGNFEVGFTQIKNKISK